jgi:hypothetical protein
MLRATHTIQPHVITVDKNVAYPPTFEALQQDRALSETCMLGKCQYSHSTAFSGGVCHRSSDDPLTRGFAD